MKPGLKKGQTPVNASQGYEPATEEQTKKAVELLCGGMSPMHVAKAVGISRGLAVSIKKQVPSEMLAGNQRKHEAQVGHALQSYVVVALDSMRKQAAYVGTEKFLKTQNAADIAKLHETMSAHMIKLLEAASRARRRPLMGEEQPAPAEKTIGPGTPERNGQNSQTTNS